MKTSIYFLMDNNYQKFAKAVGLVEDSLEGLAPFNPEYSYTSKELEPYDALATRFERAVEMGLKLFKSIEIMEFGNLDNTLRDLLNDIHKIGLITEVSLWMEMRDVRNRIAHDYLENMLSELYKAIKSDYFTELKNTLLNIDKYRRKLAENKVD